MNKRYKLLKDIPYHKAGEEFHFYQIDGANWVHGSESSNHAPGTWTNAFVTDLHQYEQWFEPLDTPTRWRAEPRQTYYSATMELEVTSSTEDRDNFDRSLFNVGNYFRTKESAQAAAEAIKAVLTYIHSNIEPTYDVKFEDGLWAGAQESELLTVIGKAKAAVSEGTE